MAKIIKLKKAPKQTSGARIHTEPAKRVSVKEGTKKMAEMMTRKVSKTAAMKKGQC
jgi:hypothetical protein